MNLLDYLPGVPDFPKPGILFRDISPLLANPQAFKEAIRQLDDLAKQFYYTHIVGIESRGFIFGSALAHHDHKGLALARKPNKLPIASHRESYRLEYGNDALEIQKSTIPKDVKVLLLDDVLATDGTLIAAQRRLCSIRCYHPARNYFLRWQSASEKNNNIRHQSVLKN